MITLLICKKSNEQWPTIKLSLRQPFLIISPSLARANAILLCALKWEMQLAVWIRAGQIKWYNAPPLLRDKMLWIQEGFFSLSRADFVKSQQNANPLISMVHQPQKTSSNSIWDQGNLVGPNTVWTWSLQGNQCCDRISWDWVL